MNLLIRKVLKLRFDLIFMNIITGSLSLLGNVFIDKSRLDYVARCGASKFVSTPRVKLGKLMCGKYARLAAEIMFGKKYVPADAWNLKYVNESLDAENGLVNGEPGDLVAFFNPSSGYNTCRNGDFDGMGMSRTCTHVGLLYDFDINYDPIIIHHYVFNPEVDLLSRMKRRKGLVPIELIKA